MIVPTTRLTLGRGASAINQCSGAFFNRLRRAAPSPAIEQQPNAANNSENKRETLYTQAVYIYILYIYKLFKLRIYFQANHASFTRASSVRSKQFKFNVNTCSAKGLGDSERGQGVGEELLGC